MPSRRRRHPTNNFKAAARNFLPQFRIGRESSPRATVRFLCSRVSSNKHLLNIKQLEKKLNTLFSINVTLFFYLGP